MKRLSVLVCLLVLATAAFAAPEKGFHGMSYLDNGTIRVGANLEIGGAITHVSTTGDGENMINSHDWGRQVQMSFYGGPSPFTPGGRQPSPTWKFLGWNPIQAGDCYGNGSKVIDHKNDGKTIYVKCIPMQWPMNNEPGECTFESWITLEGNAVVVRSQINNAREDKTQYSARGQEIPAVYTNGNYYRLFTYRGEAPFTDGPLYQAKKVWRGGAPDKVPGGPWEHWYATESWAALVREDDFGLGVWSPGTHTFVGGFAGEPGKGGPKDGPTGYIAPIRSEILDHNIQYDYHYRLVVGKLDEIRAYVKERSSQGDALNYRFDKDRQSWTLRDCSDTGWPMADAWVVRPTGEKSLLAGPDVFWNAASVPVIYVRAAFDTGLGGAELVWEGFRAEGQAPQGSVRFPVVSDGVMRTYKITLQGTENYAGACKRLSLRPAPSVTKEGATVRVEYIGTERPE